VVGVSAVNLALGGGQLNLRHGRIIGESRALYLYEISS